MVPEKPAFRLRPRPGSGWCALLGTHGAQARTSTCLLAEKDDQGPQFKELTVPNADDRLSLSTAGHRHSLGDHYERVSV
jgi:hypothetical protein